MIKSYNQTGEVKDSEDGKLVHLHGVNFSRAWNLYSLATRIGEALSSKVYSIPSLNRELTKARCVLSTFYVEPLSLL